jgi:hypothetical protein
VEGSNSVAINNVLLASKFITPNLLGAAEKVVDLMICLGGRVEAPRK